MSVVLARTSRIEPVGPAFAVGNPRAPTTTLLTKSMKVDVTEESLSKFIARGVIGVTVVNVVEMAI
jgi:hypothetical protein